MAGIEQLEIHSKSYILRWVKVDEDQTVSWSLQPHKKSLNFGIVKHPGSGGTNLTTNHGDDLTSLANPSETNLEAKSSRFSKKDRDGSTAQDQLAAKGFIPVDWHGKCEADKVSIGTYDVIQGQAGMYGLVFDNTFSKQTSKTATFVLLTYPTGAPPQSSHNLPNQANSAAACSRTSLGRYNSPHLKGSASDSVDSLPVHQLPGGKGAASAPQRGDAGSVQAVCHVGLLLKRRRKRGQGFARRFFSLDYTSCTLSYYYNRNSSKLRGAIPLSLAAVAADERRREINIDSGAEVWHLKASNAKEFTGWAHALEKASRIARGLESGPESGPVEPQPEALRIDTEAAKQTHVPAHTRGEEGREWEQVETLVSRIVGTRDALRRLVKDMAAQQKQHRPVSSHLSPASTPASEEVEGYFNAAPAPVQEKRPFWKRKASAPASSPMTPANFQPQLSVPGSPAVVTTISANGSSQQREKVKASTQQEFSMHDHCVSLLGDLDSVLAEFSGLIGSSKRRRQPAPPAATSRRSIDSTSSDEFFDAEGGESSQVVMIDRRSDDEDRPSEVDEGSIHDDSSMISDEEEEDIGKAHETAALYPAKPKSLTPLPLKIQLKRRVTIPPATVMPPSLIAFVRKNVGKDLSTISMPVSANEPMSLLQRVAEQLEYAHLLDKAAKHKLEKDRLLNVTAFAVSQFSVNRAKERAIRKPFNPLLGETFELLRTENEVPGGGFRLLVEKVTHRPVRLAMHADAANWSFSQSPAPSQKFWGKSMELTTEGRVRIALRLEDGTEELYSWTMATMFLRNVVMGEKYVEPVGNMHVTNDTTGAKAMIEFRAKGMFGGRGEDVQIETFGGDGVHTGVSLTGTWTQGLRVVEAGRGAGEQVWRAGPLVDKAPSVYGMTHFAASLNEITDLERGNLPCTDTRLRPDQRLCEQGDLDEAESWKTKLEEAQRSRRREMEEQGREHSPRWFAKVDAGEEEIWRIKSGKDGYWEERSRGGWSGVEEIFTEE